MARTTRNSNKNIPPVLGGSEDDEDKDSQVTDNQVVKTKKLKTPRKFDGFESEEDESEEDESDDYVVVDGPDECTNQVKAKIPEQLKTDKNSDKANQKDKKIAPVFVMSIGVVIAIVIAVTAAFWRSTNTGMHSDIQPKLNKLFHDFENQSEKSQRKLKMRAVPFLNHTTYPQPFVLMVVAMEDDQYAADCFATRIGKLFVSEPLVINGTLYSDVEDEKAKLEIDDKLKNAFQTDSFPKVAIIHNLELLPYDTSMLFYKYCDHDNPSYKDAAIIFTVTLPHDYLSMSSISDEVTKEGMVETYLAENSMWAKDVQFDVNKVGALLSRICDTVIVMRSESRESLQNICQE